MAQGQKNIIQAVAEYGKRLFSFIRKRVNTDEDAEDILQDVWYRFSYTSENEVIDQVSAWLFRVARNVITDKYRKKRDELLDDLAPDEEGDADFLDILLPDQSGNPETEHLRHIFWQQLMESLRELPEDQRNVFMWNELEGRTFAEIAAETGENVKTLISRKGYAVKHLRKRLEALYYEFINY